MTPGRAALPARGPLALGVVLALALAGCTTVPSTGPTPAPLQSAWVVADEWDGFARDSLWPQEWALGQWHRYRVTPEGLDLIPLAPLPPVPVARAHDEGGDPRVWRLDWPGRAPRGSGVSVSFRPAETQGLPPSLWALRQAVTSGEGRLRVVQRDYKGGRFTIVLEVVRGLGD